MATEEEIAAMEARLEALKAQRASPEQRVRSGTKEVEFKDAASLEVAISAQQAELDIARGGLRRKVTFTDAPRQGGWR